MHNYLWETPDCLAAIVGEARLPKYNPGSPQRLGLLTFRWFTTRRASEQSVSQTIAVPPSLFNPFVTAGAGSAFADPAPVLFSRSVKVQKL
jgi:hypothetical protein